MQSDLNTIQLSDADLRVAFRVWVKKKELRDSALVIEEFGVRHGSARADIAVIDESLSCYEFKSDRDTLRRLPNQIDQFGRVFTHATLITTSRYLFEAAGLLPPWWGLIMATKAVGGPIHFTRLRKALVNPELQGVDLAALLWKSEALNVLETAGIRDSRLQRKTRREVYHQLAREYDTTRLSALVAKWIKQRSDWRSPALQTSCGD